jgi:hypothetical protein
VRKILGISPNLLPSYEDSIINNKDEFNKESRLSVLRIINALKGMVEKHIKTLKDQRLNS